MIYALLGFSTCFLFEPLIINFIYFTNIDLFMDIILTKKNKMKIISHIKNGDYSQWL